jgi:transposase
MTMPTATMQRAHDYAVGEPPDRPRRRRFSAEYKMTILAEFDACVGDGDKGALLRREGLYSSQIQDWRQARDRAAEQALSAPQRQRQNSDGVALEKANRRIARLEDELAKHKLALDIAGKAHALLEMLAESAEPETKPKP